MWHTMIILALTHQNHFVSTSSVDLSLLHWIKIIKTKLNSCLNVLMFNNIFNIVNKIQIKAQAYINVQNKCEKNPMQNTH